MIGGLNFGAYWPLFLLLLIPYLWWVERKTLMDLSSKHLMLSGAVRSAIVGSLVLALMQPVIYRSGSWISVIYLLDVSESVSPAAVQSSFQWIQETNDAGRPANARFIPFGARANVFDTLDQLRQVRIAEIDQTATNMEGAVANALHSFAPHHLKRLVLLTDGNENFGHIADTLLRLKAEGVHVYTIPLSARSNGDVWIEAIMTPSNAIAEEAFPVETHVYSQSRTTAGIELRYGDKKLASRQVELVPGLNRVAFEASIKDESGPLTLEAEVSSPIDSFPANNTLRSSIVVKGPPKILYAEGRAQSARYLQSTLGKEGFLVTTVPPDKIPSSVEALDLYDAIILSDVARSGLSDQQMRSIASYVQDLGGGFILAGGENNYGADGYSKTDIERILPITFDARQPHESVAMIVVLDKSGSMGGPEMGFAREATKAPLRLLRDIDTFGVVAFDSNFYWAVPHQTVTDREQIARAISGITAGGETNTYPALEAAYNTLASDMSEMKHVILMSDGHTAQADFQGLVTRMTQAKITVSTIALGASADNVLMAKIAQWGGGRTYYLTDPSRVPQVFSEETEMTTGNTLREEPFSPVVKKNVQAFKGIDFKAAPRLLGYVATKSKETAEILLETDQEDPILARWQYGLGRTAAFTSDLKDRWSADWLRWIGYPKFWSQLVRDTMRSTDNSQLDLRVVRDGDVANISIDAIEKNGQFRNKLESRVRVVRPDQSISDLVMQQVAPGSYRARVPLAQKGPYLFRVIGDNGGPSKTLAYSYPDEYHFYPPNTEFLRAISSETKGQFQPAAQDIFDPHGEVTAVPTPLWPYLATLALLLYAVDVFLRRVRLFEN